jgi:hypothetical protein
MIQPARPASSARDVLAVGYPRHRVASYEERSTGFGTHFTDWTAVCGVSGTSTGCGANSPLLPPDLERAAAVCPACWQPPATDTLTRP